MEFTVTDRTRVRRAERASYDRQLVHRVLDESLVCHVGFSVGGQPYVIPMVHGRDGETVYLHGLPATRIVRELRGGAPVCLEATLVDGLVMARSAFHHSMNYRSVMVLGRARLVRTRDHKLRGLRAIVEHVAPGRWDDTRQPSDLELRQTHVLAIPLEEASAKLRVGPPVDDETDLDLPVWAGVIPVVESFGAGTNEGVPGSRPPLPPYLVEYRRR
jgi:hypothetical protein